MSDLRKPFFDCMCELAKADKDVILIVGDLGYSFMEDYARRFPNQFLNIGCIEQSMIGIAAGMAIAGKKPYVYSGAIFALMRPYEQVRDDIAYNNLNVKIVGTGASGFLGFTHNLGPNENEGKLLEGLPNIWAAWPENGVQLKEFLLQDGPGFIRL
jgi:transketolase